MHYRKYLTVLSAHLCAKESLDYEILGMAGVNQQNMLLQPGVADIWFP